MRQSSSLPAILAIAILTIWLAASGFRFSDLFVRYRSNAQKTPAAAATVKPSATMIYKDAYEVATPPEAASDYGGIDPKLYVQESVACYEVQGHSASAKAIMDNLDKTSLFNDACFLYNALTTVWEKSECHASPPPRADCCAEMNGRYWYQYELLQTSVRWNTCSYWLYSYACPRMNGYKQQCDAMNCPQNCDWEYDCSPNGFYGVMHSLPMNNSRPAEVASCLRDAGFR